MKQNISSTLNTTHLQATYLGPKDMDKDMEQEWGILNESGPFL